MIICSCFATNYMPRALVLAESVKRFEPNVITFFCLVEKSFPKNMPNTPFVDYWILAKNLGFENFGRFIASHNVMEGSTAVKGMLFRYLFDRFPKEEYFVYLDADIVVFSDFSELVDILSQNEIVLTPHLVSPGDYYLEKSLLNHGAYNLGFLGLKRSVNSEKFIEWWRDRLQYACYDDKQNGIFTDQKWIDLVPSFFDVFLLKEPGYNVANWTMINRTITQKEEAFFANGKPLRFIHFSLINKDVYFKSIQRWAKTDKELLWKLGSEYLTCLQEHFQDKFGTRPWSYDFLNNGEKISPRLRYAFRRDDFLPNEDHTICQFVKSRNVFFLSNVLAIN